MHGMWPTWMLGRRPPMSRAEATQEPSTPATITSAKSSCNTDAPRVASLGSCDTTLPPRNNTPTGLDRVCQRAGHLDASGVDLPFKAPTMKR